MTKSISSRLNRAATLCATLFAVGPLAGVASAQTGPADGCYSISSAGHPGTALTVADSPGATRTLVDCVPFQSAPGQEWKLEKQDDGTYKIYAFCGMNSLQMLDSTPAENGADGVATIEDDAVDDKSDVAQRWRMTPVAGGYAIGPNAQMTDLLVRGNGALALIQGSDAMGEVFLLKPIAVPNLLVNPKKGLPAETDALARAAHAMHCSWSYNWGIKRSDALAPEIEFVPMVWGLNGGAHVSTNPAGVKTAVAALLAQNPRTPVVLGYNEPDFSYSDGGSQIDVNLALQGFQPISDLKSKGITVGGPACAIDAGDWMKTFMSKAAQPPYNYNIDFIGFHDYPSEASAEGAAYGMLGYMDAVHKMYGKPIWATEFAPIHLSQKDVLTFIRIVCQGMQTRPYIVRYSMFTSEPAAPTPGIGASVLVNPDGSLTEAGQLYARM